MDLFFAQGSPDDALGFAEKLNKAGAPVMALVLAIVACVVTYYVFKLYLDEKEKRASGLQKQADDATKEIGSRVQAVEQAKDRVADEMKAMFKENLASERGTEEELANVARALAAMDTRIETMQKMIELFGKLLEAIVQKLDKKG